MGLSPRGTRGLALLHAGTGLGKVLTIRGDETGPLTVRLEPPGSVEAMGRRSIELLRDPERHRAMATAAADRARLFDADRIVPMYEALYREVAG